MNTPVTTPVTNPAAAPTTPVLNPAAQGWLKLAEIKADLFTQLQNAELECQGRLSNLSNELEPTQEAIKAAKGIYTDAKGKRLAFTRLIDEKLLTPSMEYEKRMEALLKTAGEHELSLRKEAAAKADAAAAYGREEAAYRAHITNEWFRIAAEFRAKCAGEITKTYTYCLEHKVDPQHIGEYQKKLAEVITDIKLPTPLTFKRSLIDDAAARNIIKSIRAYDPADDRARSIASIPEAFATYTQDLANAEAAIAAVQQEQKRVEAEQQAEVAAEMATNVLIAQAETATVEGPKVKRELRVVEDNSEAWAKAVIANFMKNWQYCNKYVRVKSWGKLTILQMADALAKHATETGETFQGLTMEEVCK